MNRHQFVSGQKHTYWKNYADAQNAIKMIDLLRSLPADEREAVAIQMAEHMFGPKERDSVTALNAVEGALMKVVQEANKKLPSFKRVHESF